MSSSQLQKRKYVRNTLLILYLCITLKFASLALPIDSIEFLTWRNPNHTPNSYNLWDKISFVLGGVIFPLLLLAAHDFYLEKILGVLSPDERHKVELRKLGKLLEDSSDSTSIKYRGAQLDTVFLLMSAILYISAFFIFRGDDSEDLIYLSDFLDLSLYGLIFFPLFVCFIALIFSEITSFLLPMSKGEREFVEIKQTLLRRHDLKVATDALARVAEWHRRTVLYKRYNYKSPETTARNALSRERSMFLSDKYGLTNFVERKQVYTRGVCVVDGMNVLQAGKTIPSLHELGDLYATLAVEFDVIAFFFDANIFYKLAEWYDDESFTNHRIEMLCERSGLPVESIYIVPSGVRADDYIITCARMCWDQADKFHRVCILSNDQYRAEQEVDPEYTDFLASPDVLKKVKHQDHIIPMGI